MRDDWHSGPIWALPAQAPPRLRAKPHLILIAAAITALISTGVCIVSVLMPAPPLALPFVVVCCVGCPIFASWEVPVALATLRAKRSAGGALAALRQTLEQLPETEHPLGL